MEWQQGVAAYTTEGRTAGSSTQSTGYRLLDPVGRHQFPSRRSRSPVWSLCDTLSARPWPRLVLGVSLWTAVFLPPHTPLSALAIDGRAVNQYGRAAYPATRDLHPPHPAPAPAAVSPVQPPARTAPSPAGQPPLPLLPVSESPESQARPDQPLTTVGALLANYSNVIAALLGALVGIIGTVLGVILANRATAKTNKERRVLELSTFYLTNVYPKEARALGVFLGCNPTRDRIADTRYVGNWFDMYAALATEGGLDKSLRKHIGLDHRVTNFWHEYQEYRAKCSTDAIDGENTWQNIRVLVDRDEC